MNKERSEFQSDHVDRTDGLSREKVPTKIDASHLFFEEKFGIQLVRFYIRYKRLSVYKNTSVGRRDRLVSPQLERAPGYGLYRFLGSICPPKFRERELKALHADAIQLYFEKLHEGDVWGARRVKWAMRGWLLWTAFGGAVGALFAFVTGEKKPSK